MCFQMTNNLSCISKTCGLLLLIVCIESELVNTHEFCGHSVANSAIRIKRSSLRLEQNRANPSEETPTNRQQDQTVIDETGGNQSNEEDKTRTTEARIDCTRAARASRGDTKAGALEGNNSKGDNCNTKVIETAVFLDQALSNKFTGLSGGLVDLNKLVMTIMNQVQHLFSYSSMKVPIKIKLVLVENFKDVTGVPVPNPERGDIDAYLTNFCNWQQSRLEREKRLWWDHAILLSGMDLFKVTPTRNHTGVLGLAWVGGMCKGNYSCTINEATNLESAFVIAHEIGHSLGIMHDGQRNPCDPNGFIMSERTGAGKVHWSRCSNNYLSGSINRHQLNCLDSEQSPPVESIYDLTKLRPPGQVYSIIDQCKLAYGSNYTSFVGRDPPFDSVCRELWCVAGTWAKAAHPALEGSTCADKDRVCREDGKLGHFYRGLLNTAVDCRDSSRTCCISSACSIN